ncbi:Uncharacterised protein [Mycobacteroides abscessus subsp. abscessus]|nr:Uncharacterised protein [Mycobacteroides abscessus subsp. abscessus]
MQRDGCGPLRLGDGAGVQVGVVVVVDADAEFDRHGDIGARGGTHGGGHDLPEQPPFVGKGGATAVSGDLGYRAAEVHVDVIGEAFVGHHLGGAVGGFRIDRIQL